MNAVVLTSVIVICVDSQASLDEPSRSVAIHHAKPSSLQSVTLHLSEKVCMYVCTVYTVHKVRTYVHTYICLYVQYMKNVYVCVEHI